MTNTPNDHYAVEPLTQALVACREYDLAALSAALVDAEQHLNGRHAAREHTAAARQFASEGNWHAAWAQIQQSLTLLVYAFAPNPGILPSSPSIRDCACGWKPIGAPSFCIQCGTPMTVQHGSVAVTRATDERLTTDLTLTVSAATLTRGVICVLFVDGEGLLDGEKVSDRVGQLVLDIGSSPMALQAVDQAHAQLRTWAQDATPVRMIEAPGKLARMVSPDGATVTVPPRE